MVHVFDSSEYSKFPVSSDETRLLAHLFGLAAPGLRQYDDPAARQKAVPGE